MKPRKPTQQELENIFAPKDKEMQIMREIDEPLEWFKEQMKIKLQENDHKGGWDNCSLVWLLEKLCDEVDELNTAIEIEPHVNIIKEAADVANFAMMIADVAKKRIKTNA